MIDYSARQLRGFLLVADFQSFTRAADALFITPSGLSVMITQLEAQLGFRLFDRTSRREVESRHSGDFGRRSRTHRGQYHAPRHQ